MARLPVRKGRRLNLVVAQSVFVAQVAAGEAVDAVWQLETRWPLAPWLTVLGGAAMVALVVYCYSRELSPARRPYRVLLGALRIATIVLLLGMLSEALLSGTRSGRPRFAILIDQSGSMGVVDPILQSDLPESVRSQLGQIAPDAHSRLVLAEAALKANDAAILKTLAAEHDLDLFVTANQLEPLPPGDEGFVPQLSSLAVDKEAPSTRLGSAIETLLASPGELTPQGILILTDGQVTAGAPLAAAAEAARRTATPLYWLGLGSDTAPPDIALTDLLAEEVVFVDDLVSFRATLRTTSAVTKPIVVTLRREGQDEIIAQQTIDPTTEGNATPIQFLHRPESPGQFRYELAATATKEELDASNNRILHDLTVRDGQLGVLLAAGSPSYEYRYLKHLLERDSTVKLASFLQEADIEYASADPTAVSRLPLRREELQQHDVVLLMDIDPRLVPRSFWPELRTFVSETGGGLGLVAGKGYFPHAYRDVEDIAALSPAILAADMGSASSATEGFRLAPTAVGRQRGAMQLADQLRQSDLAWRTLPELYWHAELGKLKPAAQVLATHPTETTPDGRLAPLIVSQYFGSGQVLLHAIDSTYRWRKRTGDVYFARYWVQTLRSLARGRLTAGTTKQQLTVERARYEPGETIRLRLRTDGAAGDEVTVLLQGDSGPEQRLTLSATADQRGVYETSLDRLAVGRYRALLTGGAESGQPVSASFEVVAPPGEFARLEMASAAMQAAADRSRGRFFRLNELDQLTQSLPQARRVPIETLPPQELWNRWWMLAGICGCLVSEWILRKRRAML